MIKRPRAVVWAVTSPVIILITVIVMLLAGTCSLSVAQRSFFAPVLTYEYGYPLSINRAPGLINKFGASGNGISSEHSFGIGLRWVSTDLLSQGIGIAPQVGYRFSSGSFTSDNFLTKEYSHDASSVTAIEQFEVSTLRHSFDLLLPATVALNEHISLEAGVWLGSDIARDITGTQTILSPGDAQFLKGGRSRTFASGDTLGSSSAHYGFDIGASIRIPLSSSIALDPSLHARADLSAISDLGTKAWSIGLTFSISPISAPVIPHIDSIISKPTNSLALEGRIHFTKNGTRLANSIPVEISGFNIFHRQYTELSADIVFEPGSFDLRHYTILSESQAEEFTLSNLTKKGLGEFANEAINIIAYRLSKKTSASIVLHASYPDESRELAQFRLDVLEKYLNRTWKIPIDRFSKKNMASEARTGCYITSTDADILAPVPTQWIERSYQIPHIGLEKEITAQGGLRSWSIDISQNNRILTHFSNATPDGESSITDFDLTGDSTTGGFQNSPFPLIAVMHIEDFAGQRLSAFDTLTIPTAEETARAITERERFDFIFLPGQPSSFHDLLITKCLSSIKNGALIKITNPSATSLSSGLVERNIAEEIVSKLHSKTELATEVHILQQDSPDLTKGLYTKAVTVSVDQPK